MRTLTSSAAAALTLAGCLEYSPHALPRDERHHDVHQKSLRELQSRPPPEPLRFALVGDTQLHTDETEDAVRALRARGDLAFVVQLGDFTHWGLTSEYELTNDIFRGLGLPYFVVIGIHDLLGNGGDVFRHVFGPRDFAFTYAGVRFVLIDTNSLEAGKDGTVPNLAWLSEQLAPAPDHDRAVVFSHMDPRSPDFDSRLADAWHVLLRDRGVAASFHGHAHRELRYEQEGVLHFVADDVADRKYYLVTRRPDGRFDVEAVGF